MTNETVLNKDGIPIRYAAATEVPLGIYNLAPHVRIITSWVCDWGPQQERQALWQRQYQLAYNKRYPNSYNTNIPVILYTKQWMIERIEKALTTIGKGLVLAAFPTYAPYNKSAALLMNLGFKLLEGKCYPNPGYARTVTYMTKPTIYAPDGYPHWIHIWVKNLGGVEKCGPPDKVPEGSTQHFAGFPGCCGLRVRWETSPIPMNPYSPQVDFNNWVSVCSLPAAQKFPKGWRRFALYEDYKWGVNFTHPSVKAVQECPHEYDLAKIEAWELEQPLPQIAIT